MTPLPLFQLAKLPVLIKNSAESTQAILVIERCDHIPLSVLLYPGYVCALVLPAWTVQEHKRRHKSNIEQLSPFRTNLSTKGKMQCSLADTIIFPCATKSANPVPDASVWGQTQWHGTHLRLSTFVSISVGVCQDDGRTEHVLHPSLQSFLLHCLQKI